ncbi:MAG: radical SAM protein [Candidatus Aminicenantes bacterium]|nr:radical SAM protein [Candidatus Aminicenantes bacterium]NIM79179.1 radical SAM protein [Candidatus Aminicenantes bacterium]NIN18464.1 radical SAM protein [Candidatus Aminicenantes bacterium]NIN42352.1 radical SAM protein [Candidatus Aminicenantes bacterium]NIN85118.1 radical SAM protein [Candidatus Aminicenantes bacterium]
MKQTFRHVEKEQIKGAIRKLPKLNFTRYITTNYDDILETLTGYRTLLASSAEDIKDALRSENYVFKLHGDIKREDTWILTKEQYDRCYNKSEFKDFIEDIFKNNVILFMGCSMVRDRLLELVDKIKDVMAFAILAESEERETDRKIARQLQYEGINIIWLKNPGNKKKPGKVYSEQMESLFDYLIERFDSDEGIPLHVSEPDIETLREKEWAVEEAKQAAFLKSIHSVYDYVKEKSPESTQPVITLYARSSGEQETEVGKFTDEVIYYCNLNDEAHMFGPIIEGDYRIKITDENDEIYEINKDTSEKKKGRFVEREELRSTAWFKLGDRCWTPRGPVKETIKPGEVKGLLFLNARDFPIAPTILKTKVFYKILEKLEIEIIKIIKDRRSNLLERQTFVDQVERKLLKCYNRLSHKWYNENELEFKDINEFFTELAEVFKKISKRRDISLTAFIYEKEENILYWLWANGPTSIKAINLLPSVTDQTKNIPLPVKVALEDHRPLLIHNLKGNGSAKNAYRECTVTTKYGEDSQSNLIFPILSLIDPKELEGVIDIQSIEDADFDTNYMQLAYQLAERFISRFLEIIKQAAKKNDAILPFRSIHPYNVFNKKELKPGIHEYLELCFNPMKYLLHWDKIKKIIKRNQVGFPSLVEIWPSMVCNHRCDWCRTRLKRLDYRKRPFIDTDALRILADDLKQEQVDVLISGGGEPLLHPDIHEFMAHLWETSGNIGIFTNGTRPKNFKFWEYFLQRKDKYSFVRISFNGHDPETYRAIHYGESNNAKNKKFKLPGYIEAKKTVQDILGMRPDKCTIALGSTVHSVWIDTIEDQVKHAEQLGVDFIQIRPELMESSDEVQTASLIRDKIMEEEKKYQNNSFAVKYTDSERAFKNPDYDTCYAMNLVPAVIPDRQPGWLRVLPCSYAINMARAVPRLGRMKTGTKLSDFWRILNENLSNPEANMDTENIKILTKTPINPKETCPQCRYYWLNRRIREIKAEPEGVILLDELIEHLKEDNSPIPEELEKKITEKWSKEVLDIDQAKKVFKLSKSLGFRPSL